MAEGVLEWVQQEKGKGGRPRRGWRDDVKEGTEARDRAEEDCYRREAWTQPGGGEPATAVK
jgi:hypothetical protein